MSGSLARLEAFIAAWRGPMSGDSAAVRIAARALSAPPGLHFACADSVVTGFGYQAIGANWELLDAEGPLDAPRSASAALAEAFAQDMVVPARPWLGEAAALEMAAAFIGCFDPGQRQIVTNRMYFGWHPISPASIEWAFVAFDDSAAALLLATAEG